MPFLTISGLDRRRVAVPDGGPAINVAVGGDGPPVVLLHGYPQTHVMWHLVAPRLAERFTVVAADLRGYGDSDKPAPAPDHSTYAKRAMAHDVVSVMNELGFDTFDVVGHDRGARVGHRLALDHPDRVRSLAVLDIVPTLHKFEHADAAFGLGYYHWFFLAAGNGVPEALIGAAPEEWIRRRMEARHRGGTAFSEEAMAEYVRCFSDPAAIFASCADYRAAASIDLDHDRADRKAGRRITCPVLALWGADSFVGRTYDVLDVWSDYAESVQGHALSGDHYLAEELPAETFDRLVAFLDCPSRNGSEVQR